MHVLKAIGALTQKERLYEPLSKISGYATVVVQWQLARSVSFGFTIILLVV